MAREPTAAAGQTRLADRSGDVRSIEIAREGELLAARIRLAAATLASLLPLWNILFRQPDVESEVGFAAALIAFGIAAIVESLARKPVPPPALGFFSAILDVSIVSVLHLGFVLGGQPLAATSGRVVFGAYFVVLGLSCLRNDPRICLAAGLTALLQYGLIVVMAVHRLGAAVNAPHPTYGMFRWDNQVGRLALLALATVINVAFVSQSRRHLRSSYHDLLTGLPNRRYADLRVSELKALTVREKCELVVALADLDGFKRINDQYGHAAGDRVLCQVADRLRSFCRVTDFVARYGGEEFLILLLASRAAGAIERLRLFHADFGTTPDRSLGVPIPMSLSIGVAVFPSEGGPAANLIDLADRRLYEAKAAGRNQLRPAAS